MKCNVCEFRCQIDEYSMGRCGNYEGRLVAVGKVETVVTSKTMSSVYGVNVAVREIEDMKRKVCLPLRR